MYKLLFYCIFVPLSLLPMKCLYIISNFLCFVLQNVAKYRQDVVLMNLSNSFPHKEKEEIETIAKKFYHHLSDLFLEAFKMLSLSRKGVMKRYYCKNPEIINECYERGKSVIFISGHYNNWEYMVLSLAMQFKHHGIGVGKPLSNKGFGKVLTFFRTRYGTEVIDADNVKEKFAAYETEKKLSVYMMLNDQSTGNPQKSYWMKFLNQESGIIFGPEYFAKKYNYPVFFYEVKKEKRGWYSFEIKKITDNPSQETDGFITQTSLKMLEKAIVEKPEYWLWSHKRWKHKRPQNMVLNPEIEN